LWDSWGSDGETSMGWESENWDSTTDGWGGWGDDTTVPNWNYDEFTTESYQPSMDELEEMDVEEIISAFQTMDARYMRQLLKENAKKIKKMMSKFTREEQYKIMQAMKSMPNSKGKITIQEFQEMNSTMVIRTFKALNVTFLTHFLRRYDNEIKEVIERFNKEDQKTIKTIIEKRTGGRGHEVLLHQIGTLDGSFVDINLNMSATELSRIFSKMGRDRFENYTMSLDPDSQWVLYTILNGTKFGDFLGEIVGSYDDYLDDWDSYDDSEDMLGEVFGGALEWSERKKRQAGMGEMEEATEDMGKGEKIVFMAAMGLQGFMMMDRLKPGKLPRFLEDIPSCLKQILWAPEDTDNGFICSKLPMAFKEKIREIVMMILKREIPTSFFEVDWEAIGNNAKHSKAFEKVAKIAMTKAMLPLEASDISEMIQPIKELWTEIEKNQTNTENLPILKLVSSMLDAIDTEEVHATVADIGRDIQGMVIMKKGMAVLTGTPGPAPDKENLCQLFANFAIENSLKGGARTELDLPTVWVEKSKVVYKGELCPLTRKWFWTSVARCSCSREMCYQPPDLMGKGGF